MVLSGGPSQTDLKNVFSECVKYAQGQNQIMFNLSVKTESSTFQFELNHQKSQFHFQCTVSGIFPLLQDFGVP